MPEIVVNDYTEYKFESDEAEAAAHVLTDGQLAAFRNMLAGYAKERAVLELDHSFPNATQSYVFGQQKLLGSIEAIHFILAKHEEALNALKISAENRSQQR